MEEIYNLSREELLKLVKAYAQSWLAHMTGAGFWPLRRNTTSRPPWRWTFAPGNASPRPRHSAS